MKNLVSKGLMLAGLGLALSVGEANAQVYESGQQVGIGAMPEGTPNLYVKSFNNYSQLRLHNGQSRSIAEGGANVGFEMGQSYKNAYLKNYEAGDLLFGAGGTNTDMIITQEGNVGIGTTSPTEKLYVVGNARVSGTLSAYGDLYNRGRQTFAYGTPILKLEDTNTGGDAFGGWLSFTNMDKEVGYFGYGNTDNNMYINNKAEDGDLFIYTKGNVGIGTTVPSEKLTVNGAIKTGSLVLNGNQLNVGTNPNDGDLYLTPDYGHKVYVGLSDHTSSMEVFGNVRTKNNIFIGQHSATPGDVLQAGIHEGQGFFSQANGMRFLVGGAYKLELGVDKTKINNTLELNGYSFNRESNDMVIKNASDQEVLRMERYTSGDVVSKISGDVEITGTPGRNESLRINDGALRIQGGNGYGDGARIQVDNGGGNHDFIEFTKGEEVKVSIDIDGNVDAAGTIRSGGVDILQEVVNITRRVEDVENEECLWEKNAEDERYTGHYVGIGTGNPVYQLHVVDKGGSGMMLDSYQKSANLYFGSKATATGVNYQNTANIRIFDNPAHTKAEGNLTEPEGQLQFITGSSLNPAISIEQDNDIFLNGRVSIGTEVPERKLHVASTIDKQIHLQGRNDARAELGANNYGLSFYGPGSLETNTPDMVVKSSGNVGIGTTGASARLHVDGATIIGTDKDISSGLQGKYKLFVKDGILTEKVKVAVEGLTDWADYVFADDYELMPLNEVEEFVDENNHLPGVPSAEEVVESGIDMAKMDAKLLEKIEELTLYIIAQEKRMAAMEAELKELK